MSELIISCLDVGDLKPRVGNPRTHSDNPRNVGHFPDAYQNT